MYVLQCVTLCNFHIPVITFQSLLFLPSHMTCTQGLTASGTYDHAVKLLARITPFATKAVFDPTQYAGEFEHHSVKVHTFIAALVKLIDTYVNEQ